MVSWMVGYTMLYWGCESASPKGQELSFKPRCPVGVGPISKSYHHQWCLHFIHETLKKNWICTLSHMYKWFFLPQLLMDYHGLDYAWMARGACRSANARPWLNSPTTYDSYEFWVWCDISKKTVVCVFFYHLSSAETPSREHLSVFPAMDQPTVATRLRGTGFVTGWCPKKYVQLTACTLNISILGLEPPALCLQRKTILYVLFGKHRAGGWNMLKPPNRSWADVWKNSEAINESTLP